MKKIISILGLIAFAGYLYLVYDASHKMGQSITNINGHEIVETAAWGPPDEKQYYTKWSFSHTENFQFATIHSEGYYWSIFTDKLSGKLFNQTRVSIKYDDKVNCPTVTFYKRTVFEKSYFEFIIPVHFTSPSESQQTRIEIVVSSPTELQQRIFPQGPYRALSEALGH